MFCTSRSLTIQVGEDFIVCPRGGGHKKLKNYNGYILCPDYNLICTINNDEEEELCNDMFDCVTKKLKKKEHIVMIMFLKLHRILQFILVWKLQQILGKKQIKENALKIVFNVKKILDAFNVEQIMV